MANIHHYGWQVSPYSAKTRSYLTYKQLPFVDKSPSFRQLTGKLQKAVGAMIMPVVYDGGLPMNDSTTIIAHFDSKYPSDSITPDTPKQHLVSLLLELFADEWLPLAALHYRWNYPENKSFILSEFGRNALPYFPRFIQNIAATTVAKRMSGYLPVLGISEQMRAPLENNTETLLSTLNQHFEQYSFILGDRPSLADFSLFGPIWAHLDRDPYPANLVAKYTYLKAWVDRMNGDFSDLEDKHWLGNDSIPATLSPVLSLALESIIPLIAQSIEGIALWSVEHPAEQKLPRKTGKARLVINNKSEDRLNLTYPYWMFQRIHHQFSKFNAITQTTVEEWLTLYSPLLMDLLNKPLPLEVELRRCRLWRKTANTNKR